jgi:hypothetical protein
MNTDPRRITLLACNAAAPPHAWNVSSSAPNRMIPVGTFSMLPWALDNAKKDVDRVVIDGTASPVEYLEFLATLPHTFVGDVLYMRAGGNSFLSSTGRGGDRVLYSLSPSDLEFYLLTNLLVAA